MGRRAKDDTVLTKEEYLDDTFRKQYLEYSNEQLVNSLVLECKKEVSASIPPSISTVIKKIILERLGVG